MPLLEVDLRGLAPDQAPTPDAVAGAGEGSSVLVRGPVPALAGVLAALNRASRTADVAVSWEPADDKLSRGLARDLGIGGGAEREMTLVRDDHGGVLLHTGRVEPAADGIRPRLARRFGAQAHHDDVKVADGLISRITARPEWRAVDTLRVVVSVLPMRPPRLSTGRALQIACDPARVTRDGVVLPRLVSRWTWYADDRVRWRLQP
ncbi:hypothetical protein [Trujillonella endophytica]|uniref:Uncharacterized protein n=1 Tax=Trujillonella endophytica TaxID=673521 RepID=A0A1H8UGG1_9ACTN|nr:hypothetical protein [Trujillella endophytica]SEP02309.1 hypothetical protein SAMN05660991_02888 [Trujillella endophytica]